MSIEWRGNVTSHLHRHASPIHFCQSSHIYASLNLTKSFINSCQFIRCIFVPKVPLFLNDFNCDLWISITWTYYKLLPTSCYLLVKKWATRCLFLFIFSYFKQIIRFLQQIDVKNIHPASGAGIQTLNHLNLSPITIRPGLPLLLFTCLNTFRNAVCLFLLLKGIIKFHAVSLYLPIILSVFTSLCLSMLLYIQ